VLTQKGQVVGFMVTPGPQAPTAAYGTDTCRLWEIPTSKGSKSPRQRGRRTSYFLAGSLDRLLGEHGVALVAEIPDDDGRCARDFLIAQPDEVLAATEWTGDRSSCRHEAQQEHESYRAKKCGEVCGLTSRRTNSNSCARFESRPRRRM